MKIDIVVVYVQRYRRGHEAHFVPPITGIHLAAVTPRRHQVRVIHQQVEPVPLDTDADLVALSFFSGFAAEAYRVADALRSRGKRVVAGGPHATFWPEEALLHCDAVVIGEAETVWAQVLEDAERGALRPRYEGAPAPLDGLPMPRYDLLPDRFFIQRVVQATRGCPFSCSFCTVPTINPGFRVRPVAQHEQRVLERAPGSNPLNGLACDLSHAIEILVVMPEDRARGLGAGGDEQIRDLYASVVESADPRQLVLHFQCTLNLLGATRQLVQRQELGGQLFISLQVAGAVQNLQSDG